MTAAFILLIIIFGGAFAIQLGLLVYHIWYHHKYTDEKGWHKCYDCGKAPSTIYYTDQGWRIVYHCGDCAFRKEVNHG